MQGHINTNLGARNQSWLKKFLDFLNVANKVLATQHNNYVLQEKFAFC